jgi:hypothetical protein
MNTIINKYYLSDNVVLVKANIKGNVVDCWFENGTIQEHRCLELEDYLMIK